MARTLALLGLGLAGVLLVATAFGAEPPWVAKVPDFRSSWPPPLAVGSAVPDFTLADLAGAKRVSLAKSRAGKRATLVLFLDDNCSTCRRRNTDLAATLAGAQAVEGASVLAVFVSNLARTGAKGAREFVETAKFPSVPVLMDEDDGTAKTALAWRVTVTPCAAVLDADGKLAYFGLALADKGADLVPGIVARVAAKQPLGGPAVRPPYG